MSTSLVRPPSGGSALVRLGLTLLIGSLGVAGCARTNPAPPWPPAHAHGPTPGPTSDESPEPAPVPSDTPPEPVPVPESEPGRATSTAVPDDVVAATQADVAFWQAYADGDAGSACDGVVGLTPDGDLAVLDAAQHDACVAWLASIPTAGTSLTIGPTVVDGDRAMVDVAGEVCGVQAPDPDVCGPVPDVSPDMPTTGSSDDFDRALGDVVARWTDGGAGWTPDVLVRVDGVWQLVLPLGQPATDAATGPDSSDEPPDPAGDEGGTSSGRRDWSGTCPSDGCGALPGLPPFVDGGGLSFNP